MLPPASVRMPSWFGASVSSEVCPTLMPPPGPMMLMSPPIWVSSTDAAMLNLPVAIFGAAVAVDAQAVVGVAEAGRNRVEIAV